MTVWSSSPHCHRPSLHPLWTPWGRGGWGSRTIWGLRQSEDQETGGGRVPKATLWAPPPGRIQDMLYGSLVQHFPVTFFEHFSIRRVIEIFTTFNFFQKVENRKNRKIVTPGRFRFSKNASGNGTQFWGSKTISRQYELLKQTLVKCAIFRALT